MPVTLNTRKPVRFLDAADFAAFPVWEYDDEGVKGQDETWVRPVDATVVPARSYTHVAADFTAAGGRRFTGYVTVSTLDDVSDAAQATLFWGDVALFVSTPEEFWFKKSRAELLAALDLAEADVFPLRYRLRIPIAGEVELLVGALP